MKDFVLRENVRHSTYYYLARLFDLPDAFLEEEQIPTKLYQVLEAVSPEAAEHAAKLAPALAEEGLDKIRRDHMKLFFGPSQLLAPPYGSVYLEPEKREIMGASTQDAQRLYAEAGLQKDEALKDAPDHIRVELDFMHVLIARTVAACEAGNWQEAEKYVNIQLMFLQNHLSRWVTPFAKVIRTGAATQFYNAAALVLESFIKQEFLEDGAAMLEEFNTLRADIT